MKRLIKYLIKLMIILAITSCAEIEPEIHVTHKVQNTPDSSCITDGIVRGSVLRPYRRFGMELSPVNNAETRIIAEYQDLFSEEIKTMDITKDVVIKNISDNLDVYRYEPAQDVCLIQVSVRGGEGVYSFTATYMDAELEVKVVNKGSSFGIVYPSTLTK